MKALFDRTGCNLTNGTCCSTTPPGVNTDNVSIMLEENTYTPTIVAYDQDLSGDYVCIMKPKVKVKLPEKVKALFDRTGCDL